MRTSENISIIVESWRLAPKHTWEHTREQTLIRHRVSSRTEDGRGSRAMRERVQSGRGPSLNS